MFKPGQQVIIYKLYNLEHDGAATIVREMNIGRDKGKYVVETEAGYAVIEPERIEDATEYWKKKKLCK